MKILGYLFASVMVCLVPLPADADLTGGLMAHYPFNCCDGRDESGNGNHGDVIGAVPTADRHELFNRAGHFSNPKQTASDNPPAEAYIDILDSPTLRPSNALSISVWIYAYFDTAPGIHESILAKKVSKPGSEAWNSYVIWWQGSSGQLKVALGGESAFSSVVVPMVYDAWHHIVLTWDDSIPPPADNMKLYIDNAEVGSTSFVGPIFYDTHSVLIGADRNTGEDYPDQGWNGELDDVRIYDRALSPTEIAQLFNEQAPAPLSEMCANGIDDDCDGFTDCADPDCLGEYPCTANAVASTFGAHSLAGSGVMNELTLVLFPVAAMIFLRWILRKKRESGS